MELELCENQFLYGVDDKKSDEEIIVEEIIIVIRKRYTIHPRPDLFNEYDNIEFVRRFRFRKRTVQIILTFIEERIKSKTEVNIKCIFFTFILCKIHNIIYNIIYKQSYSCNYNLYIILININNFISEIMLYHYINYYLL